MFKRMILGRILPIAGCTAMLFGAWSCRKSEGVDLSTSNIPAVNYTTLSPRAIEAESKEIAYVGTEVTVEGFNLDRVERVAFVRGDLAAAAEITAREIKVLKFVVPDMGFAPAETPYETHLEIFGAAEEPVFGIPYFITVPVGGGDTPGEDTPGGEEPGGDDPGTGGDTPGGDTPGGDDPGTGGDTPGGDTPGGEEPGGEEPGGDEPGTGGSGNVGGDLNPDEEDAGGFGGTGSDGSLGGGFNPDEEDIGGFGGSADDRKGQLDGDVKPDEEDIDKWGDE